jgi:N-acetylglucosamine-1-phosphate uridyltransferase (contains nucleotidyltransferase and I-patch acetyltransferase domains)
LAALALCGEGKVVIYVEDAVDLPLTLEGCRFEIRRGVPPDVPRIEAGCVPHLLKSRSLRCGKYRVDLGGEVLAAEPFQTVADLIQHNIEIMRHVFTLLKDLGLELLKGDVRGEVKGDVFIRGKTYEYTYIEGPAVVGLASAVLPFTYVRPGTTLYYDVKIRDEAKNAILDAYSRKQHGGYLGDTYVGPFVNFGAGTTVSNLKNTLGAIKPSYASRGYKNLGLSLAIL